MSYPPATYAAPAVTSSQALAWPGLRVERYQLPAAHLPPHHHAAHLLLLYQQPVRVRRLQGTRWQEAVFQAGDLGLYPAGDYAAVAWDGPVDNVHLNIEASYLEQLAYRGANLQHVALRDRLRFADPLPAQLGRELLRAVTARHMLGLLYAESLTVTLCHYLIEHHAVCQHRPRATGRLPGAVLARIDEYLAAHATEPITVAALADLAHLSVFHFARVFKHTTQLTPYQYVLAWKIREARQLLRTRALPVADVSTLLGFASPAHFAAAFRRTVGQSPRDYQRGWPRPENRSNR